MRHKSNQFRFLIKPGKEGMKKERKKDAKEVKNKLINESINISINGTDELNLKHVAALFVHENRSPKYE